jgi:small subunit ribosomal protein S20
LKNLERNVEQQNVEEAKAGLRETTAIVDVAASKGVIHKNKASRHVSKITRKVQSLVSTAADS